MATALKVFGIVEILDQGEKLVGWINLNGIASLSGERERGKE